MLQVKNHYGHQHVTIKDAVATTYYIGVYAFYRPTVFTVMVTVDCKHTQNLDVQLEDGVPQSVLTPVKSWRFVSI